MFPKLKNYIQTGIIALLLLPSLVLAQDAKDCDPKTDPYGLKCTGGAAQLIKGESTPLPQLIGNYIQAFLSLLGVVFLILMIYGGFKWMKARGNTTEVEKAKEVITDAVIGLGIVAGSYAITSFVVTQLSK